MSELESLVVEGCAPVIGNAIKNLYDRWNPYSNGKGPFRLNVLFNQLIEPAWQFYVASLPPESMTRQFCCSTPMHINSSEVTFQIHEQILQELNRTVEIDSDISEDNRTEILATLDSIRTLSQLCGAKRAKRLNIGDLRSRKAYCAILCRFCGHYTELYEARAVSKTEGDIEKRLSGRFCKRHKKREEKGAQNKVYTAAVRHFDRFNEVLRKLRRQIDPEIYKERRSGPDPSDFYSLVMAEIDPLEDENSPITWPEGVSVTILDVDFKPWEYWEIRTLRDTACRIVELGISEQMMKIITRSRSFQTNSEIAKEIGVPLQRLLRIIDSKRFKAIPRTYRFDRKKATT